MVETSWSPRVSAVKTWYCSMVQLLVHSWIFTGITLSINWTSLSEFLSPKATDSEFMHPYRNVTYCTGISGTVPSTLWQVTVTLNANYVSSQRSAWFPALFLFRTNPPIIRNLPTSLYVCTALLHGPTETKYRYASLMDGNSLWEMRR